MLQLIRTTSENADFRELVQLLDQDLAARDGAEHGYYVQFNTIASLQHVVVAYRNDGPVGCGAFKPFASDSVEVKRMFVQPAHRGQGVAQAVLAELEKWASELGYASGVLETGKRQPEAIRLYERSGYVLIPNYGQYVGIENSVCLQKDLGR
jgi:putative acetyltransferase